MKKFDTGPGDYQKTGCLLDYRYFKENYKITSTELGKH